MDDIVSPALDEIFPIDSKWDDGTPDDATKMKVFRERRALADERMKDWLWHAEIAYEYRESSQVPPELRGLESGVLYWCLNLCRDILANINGALTASEAIPVWSGRGFEDEAGGKAIADLFDFTLNSPHTKFKFKKPLCVADMVTCGIGALLEYFDEDILVHTGDREVMFGDVAARRLNPIKLRFDPSKRLKDVDCPEWVIYLDDVGLRYLRQKYGDKAKDIKGKRIAASQSLIAQRSSKDYDNQNSVDNTQTISGDATISSSASAWTRVAEVEYHYYMISELVEVVYKQAEPPTEPKAVVTRQSPSEMPPEQDQAPPTTEEEEDDVSGWVPVDYGPDEVPPGEDDRHHIVKRIKYRVRRGVVCEGSLLEDKEINYDTIPIALYLGEEIQNFHLPVGIMYHIRHPQDLVNTLISAVAENALATNNAGIIWDELALSEKMKTRIETHGGAPGLKLETHAGHLNDVKRFEPGSLSAGILTIWQEILKLIDRIAGRYDVQYGRPPYDMSGRGLIASQQAADLSSSGWVQGMLAGDERFGTLRLRTIQEKYVYGRALRITDDFGQAKVMHLKRTQYGLSIVSATGEMLLKDLSTAEFDLEMKIEPGATDSPEMKQKKGQILFEAGVYSPRRLAEAYGEKHADRLIEERKEWDQKLALGDAALKAVQQNPEIQNLLQNPEAFQGLSQDAQAFKALSQSDPRLEPFLRNPALLQRLIADAVAHRQGGNGTPVQPPVQTGA